MHLEEYNPSSEITVLAVCFTMFVLLMVSFKVRMKSFRIFSAMLGTLTVAVSANLMLHYLMAAGVHVDAEGTLAEQGDEEIVVERMLARGRADDKEDVIRNRLSVYHTETKPLIDHYGAQIINVEAEGEVEEISQRVLDAVK